MAIFTEPKKWGVIPGSAADVGEIQEKGSTLYPSIADLWPAIYQLALSKGGKAPERTGFNAFFKMIMERLYFIERGGVWSYDATADYPAGAVVGYSGSLYLALKDNGSGTDAGAVTPGNNTAVWQKLVLESGNAATATKLAAKRTINGTAFDGTANITTANWGTARNIAIADAAATNTGEAVSVNGSAAVTLKLPAAIKANVTGSLTGNAATATTATTAQACTGNAASATKLAAKRTIALSGAATGTATGFDGSGNITIPVTALSGSAITSAITIYDLVPDGAANHRNFYRGKDITAAFNNGTFSTNVANGTFRDIFPGDYITKSITVPQILKADGTTEYIAQKTYTVNFIIADLDIWLNRGDTATTAHHVAIVPQSVVFNSCMNETNVTTGGYAGSFMNTNVMPAFATALQNAFGASHLISFRIGLSNGVTTTTASASHPYWTGTSNWWGAWTSKICCLMSEGMVYGQSPNHSAAMDETMCGQFAAFRLNSNLVYNRQWYWLSDVVSSAIFAFVSGNGFANATNASDVFGVRPFALLV